MKSRSNRHPTSDPPEDWVDGSWTVDCICGVNFDDGEEMVDCDECGVWVHTRCFRFVKGEKSFACDKCETKAIRGNDSEETEVAQLLVELPTKTIKMSGTNNNHSNSISHNHNGNHNNNVYSFGNSLPPPSRRTPYRLWVNKPMEERVHVQGVPGVGDDPGIFQGFSMPFASQLWKCSGYVPKKFNFSYKEFPCWDQEEGVEGGANANANAKAEGGVEGEANANARAEGGVENVANKGAGVLFSLSKENEAFSFRRGQAKSGGSHRKSSKERKSDNSDSKKIGMPSLSKKDKGICRPILLQCSGKRSRDDSGTSKDRNGKKKAKAIRREQDSKKDKADGVKAAVIHSTSAKQTEVYESKAHKGAANLNLAEAGNIEKPKRTVSIDEGNAVLRSPEVSALNFASEKRVKDEKPDDAANSVQKTEIGSVLTVKNPIKKEGPVLDAMGKNQGSLNDCQTSDISDSKPLAEDVDDCTLECNNNNEVTKDVETTVPLISGQCTGETKLDANADHSEGVMKSHPPDIDVELESDGTKLGTEQAVSPDQECEGSKLNEIVTTNSQPHEHEVHCNDKTLEVLSGSQLLNDEGKTENKCNNKLKYERIKSPIRVQKFLSDSKEVTRVTEETSKLSVETLPPPSSNHKAVSVGKSSPCSSNIVISKSSLCDKNRVGNPSSIGKRTSLNSSMGTKKESATLDQVKVEVKYEKTKIRDNVKSCTNTMSKASHPSKSVTSPVLKPQTSLGKDSMRHPFSKRSSAESASLSSGDEPAGSLQTQLAYNTTGQHKSPASGGLHRNEKVVQPNLQSSSRPTQSSLGHPPPSSGAPAGLSDEELALLLHQELNSSPRVPRVPRVRHPGSLPQLSSASPTSMLIKRGTSGGKDQHTFSRRKNKEGSRSSREHDSEARKVDKAPSSPDSVKTSDAGTQAEGQSEMIHSVRKNADDVATSTANSGPSSTDANELKSSSTRDSPVNKPEDDTGTTKGLAPIHRTLPGLIAEIMGAGRRMTYEELCNAVLPHWQNLRKHNGERYAYSSHSQAVLDCLRNRSEWARLVDRGPKTNASRKKRKIDVEPPNTESEDGDDKLQRKSKSKTKSFESNKEEFPKGRRKARKRRRLALRGRGVSDDRKTSKVVARSDDSGSLSNSSEDSGSSEDDSHGSEMCAAKSEVSASSADLVAAQ